MDDALKKLQEISDNLDSLNREPNEEERVWAEELAERRRLGLEGDAAIVHYNEWMDNNGMGHLKVPDPENKINAEAMCAIIQMRDCAARNGLQGMSLEEINEIINEVRHGNKTTDDFRKEDFSDNEPNDETLAAMEEAINGNNLETLNIDDLNKLINNPYNEDQDVEENIGRPPR